MAIVAAVGVLTTVIEVMHFVDLSLAPVIYIAIEWKDFNDEPKALDKTTMDMELIQSRSYQPTYWTPS
jgi:hypothetical protein